MLKKNALFGWALILGLLMYPLSVLQAQTETETEEEEEILELSPFEVLGSDSDGYRATHTLAGTRIRTQLEDVGSSIQVITADFLQDTAVTDNRDLLQYTTNTEVGGVDGNFGGAGNGVSVNESFANPSNTTRVRGLAAADNTRNFFLSSIPWDGYNVDRVDIQRGPNAILFGFGSPAGIINTGLIRPFFDDEYKVEFRIYDEASFRGSFDFNKELIQDQVAVRVAGVMDNQNFRQDPAFEDDERLFISTKIEPEFLQTDWSRTSFNAYFETGNIDANRPRSITPQDRISGWFRPVRTVPGDLTSPFNPAGGIGMGTFTPRQLEDDVSEEPNQGQNRPTLSSDGRPNPYYIPLVGNFGQVFGGPIAFIPNSNDGIVRQSFVSEYRTTGGLAPDGSIDGRVGGIPFSRMGSIDLFSTFARDAGLEFADFGQYKNVGLSDRSTFDFFEQLLDGPNKSEQQEWDNWNLSWQQTFFNDRIGFELVHDHQEYFQTQTALITDGRQAIMIDINSELTDGTINPNAGRPFVSDSGQFGNGFNDSERDATRFTAFAEHNFEDYGDNFFTRFLGRQNLTFLLSEEEVTNYNASWQRHAMGQDYRDFFGVQNVTDNVNAFNQTVYIGPSLFDRTSAAGLNLQGIQAPIQIPDSTEVRYWDTNWNAPTVDPAAEWITPDGGVSTQSENPANYVGWTSRTFSIEKADASNPNNLARGGNRSRDEVSSEALVLQNYFWDGSIVGTYGWRRDVANAYASQAVIDPNTGLADLDNLVLPSDPDAVVEAQTSSWSTVVHLHRLPFLNDRLPIGISLYYNESENFQPAAGRVDLFGRSIAPPSGDTIDRSILLQTKDGKYSLRATRFTTEVFNSSADRIQGDWFLGALQAWGNNWRNIFALDNNNGTFDSPTGENTFAPRPGQTEEEAAAEEAAAIAGWDAHIENLRALSQELTGNPNAFDETYQLDRSITSKNGISATTPSGLSFTQDSLSEGWEFEFSARPVSNWNITFNAAKVKAIRNNVGGEALLRYVDLVNNDLNNTPAGDLRLWWGGAGSPTFLQEWNRTFNANFNLTKLLEGTAQPEIREWRFNLVTNYSFNEGALKGFNVGMGYRWQDDVIIGFRPEYTDATQTDVTFDLENPFLGPTEDNLDLWVGYQRNFFDKFDWRVQLNVRNVTGDDELIPINTQADGSVAAWRLGAATTWTLTNTFNF